MSEASSGSEDSEESGISEPGRSVEPGDEELVRLKDELLRDRKPVREAELKTSLEIEIISSLFDGGKTVAELVEIVFGLDRDDADFMAQYSRVWRAAQDLASRGFVSRSLFGKEKPYRLTSYCLQVLFSGPDRSWPELVSRIDISLYTATVLAGAVMLLVAAGWFDPGDIVFLALNSVFFLLLGFSSLRTIETLLRVA